MKRLLRSTCTLLLLAVCGATSGATSGGGGPGPAETFDQALILLRRARGEYAAELQAAEDALANAKAENERLQKLNGTLIERIEAQATEIVRLRVEVKDLKERLAECEAGNTPAPPRLSVFTGTTHDPLRTQIIEAPDVDMIPIFIYVHMDPDLTGSIDPDRLRKYIPAKIPDAGYEGPVCLDLEGPYTRGLAAVPGSAEWNHTIEQMALAADVVKAERPGARIAFWGLPTVWYLGWEDGGPKAWAKCRPETRQRTIDHWTAATTLIERIDWFTPSLYDFYPVADLPAEDAMSDDGYAAFVAEIARAMKPAAPVLWSVSHRTYNKHGDWYLSLLSASEIYEDQIAPSLANGDGCVWWGGDQWYYSERLIPAAEIAPGMSWPRAWSAYFRALHEQHYWLFRQLVLGSEPAGGD